jgi:hypothetical protein
MIKFIKILCLTCVLTVTAFAQNQPGEYKKNEFYGGYSNQQIDGGGYSTANGFEGAYVRNIHRYFGIKADVSGAYRNSDFEVSTSDMTNGNFSYRGSVNTQVYNFLGGVQIKNNASKARFKPFAHVLAGVAVNRTKLSALTCTQGNCPTYITSLPSASYNTTHFAMAVGGGLDIRINDKIDFRAIQVDYNPIWRGTNVQNNVRFGIGFVFK